MDLARKLRERGSDVPMVIYTMDKSAHVREWVVEAGANYVTEVGLGGNGAVPRNVM